MEKENIQTQLFVQVALSFLQLDVELNTNVKENVCSDLISNEEVIFNEYYLNMTDLNS